MSSRERQESVLRFDEEEVVEFQVNVEQGAFSGAALTHINRDLSEEGGDGER